MITGQGLERSGLDAGPGDVDEVLHDLCDVLLASLPRSDQRGRGLDYVHGLIHARGRKSIRNIASLRGGRAAEQRLHHFVCGSTWRWDPPRVALARYVAAVQPPQAWVVRPLVITKTGENSVGVERCSSPAFYTQRAVGVWLASERLACPVNWRLLLSGTWLGDPVRRAQAGIPAGACPETMGMCAVRASAAVAGGDWGLPARPVVVDVPEVDALAVLGRLRAAGLRQQLVRVDGRLRLAVADPALPGRGDGHRSAAEIMRAAAPLRRPVPWQDPGRERRAAGTVYWPRVRVRVPGVRGGGGPAGGSAPARPDGAGPAVAGRAVADGRRLVVTGRSGAADTAGAACRA
ncbi:ISXo8 transposase [Streptomyces viridochromogenes DSM 40736]|uniref:ISXo8 transposase n=1 Tax=Streptomyces viridochromogenes (strain DSM 40736 / JCM 4977 / BCRC 1201 / Tue 494) TaxID=591159 RepID=D9XDP5_STRVT|nr:transposase [Streptomyces viridochromogenes]EFL30424.1 ISXo8 transposase [Streptomyces viridochromogenes DSM 40736]